MPWNVAYAMPVVDAYVVSGFSRTKTWLAKPFASGGGRGIERWDGGAVPPRHYLQERIDGVPG